MTVIAGAFTATYGGEAIGQVENGFTIEWFVNKRLVRGDLAGDSPIDAINRGAEVFVEFTAIQYDSAAIEEAFWPTFTGSSTVVGNDATIGALDSANWKSLVLTAVADTPAAGLTSEDVWTFPRTVLAEGFPVRLLLGSDLRDIPLRMRVYRNGNTFFTRA